MSRFRQALRSSVGTKIVMALTGIALLGFVLAHMAGNLQVFAGREKLNAYAKSLQDLGPVLWAMRLGLLAVFAIHVASAFRLQAINRAARPEPYVMLTPNASTYASRTMIWSGVLVLAFAAYHLAHFTWGWVHPEAYGRIDAAGRHDVYAMVVLGFRVPWIALTYVAAQVLLGLHIAHGASSLFQTLGCTGPRLEPVKKAAGPVLAVAIVLGNCSMPLAILLRLAGGEVR